MALQICWFCLAQFMIPVQKSSERLPVVPVPSHPRKLKPLVGLANVKLPSPIHQMRPATMNLYFTGKNKTKPKTDNNKMKLMNE